MNNEAPLDLAPFKAALALRTGAIQMNDATGERLVAELERLRASSQHWRPISQCDVRSKPGEDRRDILVFGPEVGRVTGYVIDYGDGTQFAAAHGFHGSVVTHWMPLPDVPESQG